VPEALPRAMLKVELAVALRPMATLRSPVADAPANVAPSAPPRATAETPVAVAPAFVPLALPIAIALRAPAVGATPVLVESLLPNTIVRAMVVFAASPMAILSVRPLEQRYQWQQYYWLFVKVLLAVVPTLILSVPVTPELTEPLPAKNYGCQIHRGLPVLHRYHQA